MLQKQALLALSDHHPRLHPSVTLAADALRATCEATIAHLSRVHRESVPEVFAKYASDISTVLLRLSEAGTLDEQRAVAISLDALVTHVLPRINDDGAAVKV